MTALLARRAELPERMDRPDCDEVRLLRTVRQFRWINAVVARYRRILRREVLDHLETGQAYRVVDLGAGGCEIAVWLLRAAARRGVNLSVTAVDADARLVRFARARYADVPGLEVRELNAFDLERLGPVDYVFSNHMLHHLPDTQVTALLRLAGQTVRCAAVFSDLERNPWSYWGYSLAALAFLHRSYARYDGRLSVRKGFRVAELQRHVTAAGQAGTIQRLWPGRLVVVLRRAAT